MTLLRTRQQSTKLLNRSYRRQSLSFDQTSYGIEMNFNAPSKIFLNGKEFLLVRWVAIIQANLLQCKTKTSLTQTFKKV